MQGRASLPCPLKQSRPMAARLAQLHTSCDLLPRNAEVAPQEAEVETENMRLGQHPPGTVAETHGALEAKHDIL